MPKHPENKVSDGALFRVLSHCVCMANNEMLFWVSDRTQAKECNMARSTVFEARRLLEKEGWFVFTGRKRIAGVKEFRVSLPGFTVSGLNSQATDTAGGLNSQATESETSSSGTSSGLSSGLDSGTSSGLGSGLTSGLDSGLTIQAKTEHNETDINPTKLKLGDDGRTLFIKALKCELELRPSNIPEAVLAKSKRDHWSPFIRKVLDMFPGSENDSDALTYFLSLVNPDDLRFRCSASTLAVLNNRYTDNPVEEPF